MGRHKNKPYLVVVLIVLVFGGLVYVSLPFIALTISRYYFAQYDLSNISFRFEYPSFGRIVIKQLSFDYQAQQMTTAISIDEVVVDYTAFGLLFGKLNKVAVNGGFCAIREHDIPSSGVGMSGRVDLRAIVKSRLSEVLGKIPIRNLDIKRFSVSIDSFDKQPFVVSAEFDRKKLEFRSRVVAKVRGRVPFELRVRVQQSGDVVISLGTLGDSVGEVFKLQSHVEISDDSRVWIEGVFEAELERIYLELSNWLPHVELANSSKAHLSGDFDIVLPIDSYSSLEQLIKSIVLKSRFEVKGNINSLAKWTGPLSVELSGGMVLSDGGGAVRFSTRSSAEVVDFHFESIKVPKIVLGLNEHVTLDWDILSGEWGLGTVELLLRAPVAISEINAGVVAKKLALNLELIGAPHSESFKVRISEFSARLLGGELTSADIALVPLPREQQFVVAVRGVDLAQILALHGEEQLTGSGLIDGELPITLSGKAVSINRDFRVSV